MAQPVVQQPTLSPPLSPNANSLASVVSPISELGGTARQHSSSLRHVQQIKKAPREASASSSTRPKPRSQPASNRAPTSNRHVNPNGHAHDNPNHNGASHGHLAKTNRVHSENKGVQAAKDPTIAEAPAASFSVATKPQDRDPSLLRQPPATKAFDGLSSYALDPFGRIPASDYNYSQRDKLVTSAQQSAIESGNYHWIALMDLAHLASQHHMSPYSVIKFGPRGSPFAYIPITLQQPEVVENTMLRQREEELEAKSWLIAKRPKRLGGVAPMDSDDDLPVLSLPSQVFKQISSRSATRNGAPTNLALKRPASLTTPPDTRASRILRTDDPQLKDREQVEQGLGEAMSDSIDKSASRQPMDVLPPPDRESSSSEQDEAVASPKPADQVDLSNFDPSTRMVEIGSNNAGQQKHNGVAHELMTSSQAGSNVQVGRPMDKERTMAQQMEEATATDKPAHPCAPSNATDSCLGPLNPSDSTTNGSSNANGNRHGPTSEEMRPPQQIKDALAIKTSDTHPIHISPILPDDLLAGVGRRLRALAEPQLLRLGSSNGVITSLLNPSGEKAVTAATESYFDGHAQEQIHGDRLIRLRGMLDLTSITATDPSANYLSQSQLAEQASRENTLSLSSSSAHAKGKDGMRTHVDGPAIGNLLLSSCPGKKVRLSGPVRGRGAICRDLGLDLTRIFSIGVRAVVCCLNDQELSYLGAPWSEYEAEADRLGLEIYRLPMAEGFAPTNVEEMDAAVTGIVTDCTLRGINVLVHCRGGVGRAGLIACSWLVKMGFVGEGSTMGLNEIDGRADVTASGGSSAEIIHRTTSAGSHDASTGTEDKMHTQAGEEEQEECDEILDTVRCLIETIRRRRSPKAIETAEQVRFLVEYVTFLHRQERLHAAAASQKT